MNKGRYLVFMYMSYYPEGAAADFVNRVETMEDAYRMFKDSGNEFMDILDLEIMNWYTFSKHNPIFREAS